MTNPSLSHKVASVALTLVIIAPIAASAQQPGAANGIDQAPRVTVKYGDLDLSRPEGAALLYTRVQSAAKTTCAQFDDRDLGHIQLFDACVSHAVEAAVTQINRPAVSALYTAKTGKKLASSPILSASR